MLVVVFGFEFHKYLRLKFIGLPGIPGLDGVPGPRGYPGVDGGKGEKGIYFLFFEEKKLDNLLKLFPSNFR